LTCLTGHPGAAAPRDQGWKRARATDLTYSLAVLEAPSDLDAAQRGVEDMLDRVVAGIDQGLI
jgi:hypothetical protein